MKLFFSFCLKIWKTVSYFGVQPDTPSQEAKRIIVANQIAFTNLPLITFIGYTLITTTRHTPALSISVWFTILNYIAFGGVLLINYFGYTKIGRFCLFLAGTLGTITYLTSHHKGTHETMTLHFSNLIPFVIFELKERLLYFLSYATFFLLCVAYINDVFYKEPFLALQQSLTAPSIEEINFNLFLGLSFFGAAYFYFVYQNYQSENRLERANKALTQTLEELKSTQEQLILAEKQAALSKLVSGIAHEINTPLGAIDATAVNHIEYIKQAIDWATQALPDLPPVYLPQFIGLIHTFATQHTLLESKPERALRKQLIQELETFGVPDAQELAARLSNLGFKGNLQPYLELIRHPKWGNPVLEAALHFGHLYHDVTVIRTSVKRTEKVVQTLKLYSSLQAPSNAPRINLTQTLLQVIEAYKQFWVSTLTLENELAEDCWVYAYPEEVNIVWQNILFNAIQATKMQGKIQIKLYKESKSVYCSIKDNGSGIEPNIVHRVFEPFFTTKGEGEGIGLGLDIAYRIIEKQGGTITVEALPNNTTLIVQLPVA